jgi:hypothetical protein
MRGHRRQGLRGDSKSLARDCDRLSHRRSSASGRRPKKGLFAQEDALVALAGRHVKWTRLAVQQQRFEPDSNADQKTMVLRHRCIYLRFIYTDR